MIPFDMLLLVTGSVGVFVYMLWQYFSAGRMKKRLKRVAAKHQEIRHAADSLRRSFEDSSLPLFARLIKSLPSLARLRFRLERAGASMTAERYLLLSALITLSVFAVISLLFGKSPALGLFAGIALGVGGPHIATSVMIGKRMRRMIALLPDALDLIVRGLRSGIPVSEGIVVVSKEIGEPIAGIFEDMANAIKLGVPFEKCLYDMAKKLGTTEFYFFATSIALQRETGGNLSEILSNLSDTIRKRHMMRLKIRAMASEATASASIISALPFMVIGALLAVSPEYMDPLFHDYRGNIAAGIGALSLFTGIGIMMRMTKFEI